MSNARENVDYKRCRLGKIKEKTCQLESAMKEKSIRSEKPRTRDAD